ncbi:hypothetical protein [Roseibium sp. RKSG952]|uniref:hypothetical protein n=1 Tax=Roseibium sp. RKSG952 TaxID=2529384 RepID=UPI0012BD284E|nr:hypothetical protein [Roseibium sp. RKSG952]MTH95394.1 hypothetical protein [Roseibium sp. RKSG952]
MSEVQLDAAVRKDASASEKRTARSYVSDALINADAPLVSAKLSHRFLPGLWQAAMNIVLEWFEIEHASLVLRDRLREIAGDGDNWDCPAVSFDDETMDKYVAEVTGSAGIILQNLETAYVRMQDDDIDDHFPTSVLDAALVVLVNAWGPLHTRRALTEQVQVLLSGVNEPVNFMEPCRLVDQRTLARKRADKRRRSEERKEHHDEVRLGHDQVPSAPALTEGSERWITAFTSTDVSPDGEAAWVVSLRSHDKNGRIDERTFGAVMKDPTGRAAAVEGLRACVMEACRETLKAHLTIETPSEFLIRGVTDAHVPGVRLENESDSWREIDEIMETHSVHHRLRSRASDADLSVRSAVMMRDLLGS